MTSHVDALGGSMTLQSILDMPDAQLVENLVHILECNDWACFFSAGAAGTALTHSPAQSAAKPTAVVGAWGKRVEALLTSNAPERQFVGVHLAGVTARSADHDVLERCLASWVTPLLHITRTFVRRTAAAGDCLARALLTSCSNEYLCADIAVSALCVTRDVIVQALQWPDARRAAMVNHLPKFATILLKLIEGDAVVDAGSEKFSSTASQGIQDQEADAAYAAADADVDARARVLSVESADTPSCDVVVLGDAHRCTLLQVLGDCLRVLKASMRPYVARTQVICGRLLDDENPDVRQHAASALAQSTACHGEAMWLNLFGKALKTLRKLVHKHIGAFSSAPSLASSSSMTRTVAGAETGAGFGTGAAGVSTDDFSHFSQLWTSRKPRGTMAHSAALVRQFSSTCELLVSCLKPASGEAPRVVEVPVRDVLALVSTVLQCELHAGALGSFSGSKLTALAFWMVLPQLQSAALRVLSALIRIFGRRLLPHASSIMQWLVELLRRTCFDPSHGMNGAFHHAQLRSDVYGTVILCIEEFGSTLVGAHTSPLVALAIDDIPLPLSYRMSCLSYSHQNMLQYSSSEGTGKGKATGRRQSRRQQQQVRLLGAGGGSAAFSSKKVVGSVFEVFPHADVQRVDAVGVAATRTMSCLLESCGQLLDSLTRISIDKCLISVLLALADGDGTLVFGLPDVVRLGMYNALLSSVVCPVSAGAASPMFPYASEAFGAGLGDASPSVRRLCTRGCTVLRVLAQPRIPAPLQWATQADSLRTMNAAVPWNPLQFSFSFCSPSSPDRANAMTAASRTPLAGPFPVHERPTQPRTNPLGATSFSGFVHVAEEEAASRNGAESRVVEKGGETGQNQHRGVKRPADPVEPQSNSSSPAVSPSSVSVSSLPLLAVCPVPGAEHASEPEDLDGDEPMTYEGTEPPSSPAKKRPRTANMNNSMVSTTPAATLPFDDGDGDDEEELEEEGGRVDDDDDGASADLVDQDPEEDEEHGSLWSL